MDAATHLGRGSFARLQRFVRKVEDNPQMCELCSASIITQHEHLLETGKRRVVCACTPCAILFGGHVAQRYRRIPRDVQVLREFAMDDQEWASLLIPINLAYFFHNSELGRVVANYPSPGGAMESSLDLEYWGVIANRNPVLKKFEPDVEALLVNRISGAPEYFRVPIDHCFRLVGLIRTHWRGLSGGSEVWQEIDGFFRRLNEAAGGTLA